MRRNIVIVLSFAASAVAIFAAGTVLSRDSSDIDEAPASDSRDFRDDAPGEQYTPRFTPDEVRLLAQQRLNDYRSVDPVCDPPEGGDTKLWIVDCVAIERDCGDLTDDVLAECLATYRCEQAEHLAVRRECSDSERSHVLLFDDVRGEFLD